MIRRLLLLAPVVAVAACLVLLPACGKKAPPVAPGGDPNVPAPGAPSGVASDYVVFAHLNAKDVIGGAQFAAIKKSFGPGDAEKMWELAEKQAVAAIGVQPGDLASLTVFVTEFAGQGPPKFVAILAADKAFDKAALLKTLEVRKSEPDGRGFYTGGPGLIHFADEKTAVALHPDLADRYLAGYAKDRSGWPVTADLMKAAQGHSVYAQVNVEKIPTAMRSGREMQQFAPLLAAKVATLTLDLKGKTLALNVRGSFPDADAAGKAKETMMQGVGLAAFTLMGAGDESQMGAMAPALTEAKRAIQDVKIDVAGSDLTLAASYTADFDFAALAVEAAKKVKGAAERMVSSNNLKQIGLALHSIHDAQGAMPVHGVGKNGAMLKAGDKPLLSWRVAILPYLEQDTLYKQFKLDEPWDSDHNKKLIDKMPKTFAPPVGKSAKPGHTHYQMAVGPNAMEPRGWTLVGITDGTSNTLAVAEAAQPVIWTKPDDIMLPGKDIPKDLKKKFGGLFPGGFNALLWDGSVRFIRDTVSDTTLAAMLTPAGGEVIRDE